MEDNWKEAGCDIAPRLDAMAAVAAARLTVTIFAYVFVNLVLLGRARSLADHVRVTVISARR